MRQPGLAVACAALCAGPAAGQLGKPGDTNTLPAAMPGQVVGTGINLNPVGTPISKAVPSRADIKKLENPLLRAYDPSKPYDVFKGTNLDPKSVIAPVAGFPGTGTDPTLLDKLSAKLGSVTSFFKPPAVPPRPTYTPGLSRRNRERAMERTWRRD